MRYFLDTEYNGWGGELLSLALVPDDGEELYIILDWQGPLVPWVERHVLPYFDSVPDGLRTGRMSRIDAARTIAHFLAGDPEPLIVADWPEDIAQLSMLLLVGSGDIVDIPSVTFRFERLPGFSTAANSEVPHNALHDARALRHHLLGLE